MPSLPSGLAGWWRRLSRLDKVALGVVVFYSLVWSGRVLGVRIPPTGFLGFLALVAGGFLFIRLLVWFRRERLWSLRNRLVVAYLFIAVVPVLLLIGIGWLSAFIIYAQLGAHLLQTDLQSKMDRLSAIADAVSGDLATRSSAGSPANGRPPRDTAKGTDELLQSAGRDLPGLQLTVGSQDETLARADLLPSAVTGSVDPNRFAGLVQDGDRLWMRAVVARGEGKTRAVVSASVPVGEELLNGVAPELGLVQLTIWRAAGPQDSQGLIFESGEGRFVPLRNIVARSRRLPPPANWMDFEVTGTCKFEAVALNGGKARRMLMPVFAPFSARASQLNRRLFSSLGDLSARPIQLLVLVAVVFLFIEIVALRTGIQLTRSITHAVDDLSRATQRVQAGDFTQTVRIHQKDQLGALGESFNEMIASISALIQEQRQRQRLENELSIAREVQAQLFPQTIPSVPGIELAAVCHAARVVSGDYYDFISFGPNQVGIVIADISGKGISAALLMASLQAALRSQVLLGEQVWRHPAELVARLNRHLFLNTSTDRYATLFYAVYDGEAKTLRYTNAGHLPPYYVVGESVSKLEEGGMVVGLFEEATYVDETVAIEPGGLLVAYSDGLVEAENVYGEEFTRKGLLGEILRRREDSPEGLAEGLVQAAEEWGGTPEQADDMTVIVARIS